MGYANLLNDMKEYNTAQYRYKRVLKARELAYGTTSHEALAVVDKLANLLFDQKQYDKAKEMYQRVLDGREIVLGKMHIDTLSTSNNYANLLYIKAISLLRSTCMNCP